MVGPVIFCENIHKYQRNQDPTPVFVRVLEGQGGLLGKKCRYIEMANQRKYGLETLFLYRLLFLLRSLHQFPGAVAGRHGQRDGQSAVDGRAAARAFVGFGALFGGRGRRGLGYADPGKCHEAEEEDNQCEGFG
jgi:hypothetical protein